MNISMLFENPPSSWGLRGDPYLWKELAEHFAKIELPDSEETLKAQVEGMIKALTGKDVSHDFDFYVKRYSNGGMSTGMVSCEFWINKGIPLLIKEYQVLKHDL